jgi:uncharacterized protein (TIGR02996 family)
MVILFIRRDGHLAWHEVFHHEQIQIGRADSNDLVLDHFRIDGNHATLLVRHDAFAIDGRRTSNPRVPLVIQDGSVVIEPFVLGLERYTDPYEIDMLLAIGGGDDATRLVYADWLEEREQVARAELLRAQVAILQDAHDTAEFAAIGERLYALRMRVPPGWQAHVARPAIDLGDAKLAFRIGFGPTARRIAGEPYAVIEIWIGDVRITAAGDTVSVPPVIRALERDLERAAHLTEVGERWLSWGSAGHAFTTWMALDGDHAVLTFAAPDGRDTVVTRLPLRELVDRLSRLLAILAGS